MCRLKAGTLCYIIYESVMKLTVLVENTSKRSMAVEHGLSLYIKLDDGCSFLFDFGQNDLFAKNAEQLNCNINDVDFAVVSHGHYDHGGGLKGFFERNRLAKVYIREKAFAPHYSLKDYGMKYIGLDADILSEYKSRLILCDEIFEIRKGITSFVCRNRTHTIPQGNCLLYGADKQTNDDFLHEQNVIIEENDNIVLLSGCSHGGIENIIEVAENIMCRQITHVIGGLHLVNSGMTPIQEHEELVRLSNSLLKHKGCKYYTMHCTGGEQYDVLKSFMGDKISYLSCGETIRI